MSYVSPITRPVLFGTNVTVRPKSLIGQPTPTLAVAHAPSADALAASLEAALLVSMMSGLSLIVCTIAAGAF